MPLSVVYLRNDHDTFVGQALLDAKTQKCLTPGPPSPRVSYLIQNMLRETRPLQDKACVLINTHMDQSRACKEGLVKVLELQEMEGCMEEVDLEQSVG